MMIRQQTFSLRRTPRVYNLQTYQATLGHHDGVQEVEAREPLVPRPQQELLRVPSFVTSEGVSTMVDDNATVVSQTWSCDSDDSYEAMPAIPTLRRIPRCTNLVGMCGLDGAVAAGADATVIQELIHERPAVVHEEDAFGSTPLHRAAWQGDVKLVRLLLQNGAHESAKRVADGRTPLDVALLRTEGGAAPEGLSEEPEVGPRDKLRHTKAMTEVAFLLRGAARDRQLAAQQRKEEAKLQVSSFPSFSSVSMEPFKQQRFETFPRTTASYVSSSPAPEEKSSHLDVSVRSLTSLWSVSTCVSTHDVSH